MEQLQRNQQELNTQNYIDPEIETKILTEQAQE